MTDLSKVSNERLKYLRSIASERVTLTMPISQCELAPIIDEILSLRPQLAELQKQEPVFFINVDGDDWIQAGRIPGSAFDFTDLPDGVNKLYAAPVLPSQPPAVPDDLLTAVEEVIRISDRKHEAWDRAKAAISSYRAATLQPATSDLSAMTSEHRRVIEMLLKVCGCAFELMDDGCQMEVDGEPSVVVPYESAHALSDALDEIENSLPDQDDDRPNIVLTWSAVPRAALKSLLSATERK